MKSRAIRCLSLVLIVASVGLSSCYKNYFETDKLSTDINWQPNVAGAVVNTSLTIRDMLRDYDTTHLIVEDQTNFLSLIYNKRIYSLPAHEFITLPDMSLNTQYIANDYISQGFPVPNGTVAVSKNLTAILNLVHAETFDSIILKYAVINVGLTSTFQHNGILNITLPNVTMFGVPYTHSIPVTAGVPMNVALDNLTGYKIDLTQTGTNQFPVIATLTLNNSGATVLPAQTADLSLSFTGLQYDFIYGDIGNYTIIFNQDTVHIEIFDKAYEGYAYFVDPKLKFQMHNSLGVPIGFTFLPLSLYSTTLQGSNIYPLPVAYNPFLLNAPSTPYDSYKDSIVLDTMNFPLIRDLIRDNPKYLFFGGTGITNPVGTNQYNFITDSSRFSVDLEVELPLWGYASLFALQDTVEFLVDSLLKDSTDIDYLKWIKFRLNVENGMPMDAIVQLYFTDTFGYVYDSLFYDQTSSQIVNSGVLGANGKIVASTNKTTDIIFENQRLQNLKPVQQILVRARLKTTNEANQQRVRFYSYYSINVKMGVQVQGDVDIHDLK